MWNNAEVFAFFEKGDSVHASNRTKVNGCHYLTINAKLFLKKQHPLQEILEEAWENLNAGLNVTPTNPLYAMRLICTLCFYNQQFW